MAEQENCGMAPEMAQALARAAATSAPVQLVKASPTPSTPVVEPAVKETPSVAAETTEKETPVLKKESIPTGRKASATDKSSKT